MRLRSASCCAAGAAPQLLLSCQLLPTAANRCNRRREGFDYEARFLRTHFGHLGNGGSAYVLGDMFNGLQVRVNLCALCEEMCV